MAFSTAGAATPANTTSAPVPPVLPQGTSTADPTPLRPGVASSTALSAGRVFAVTAELLRDSPGYLVPGSRASLDGRVPERLRARAETLRSWRGPERAWFLLRLLADAGPRR